MCHGPCCPKPAILIYTQVVIRRLIYAQPVELRIPAQAIIHAAKKCRPGSLSSQSQLPSGGPVRHLSSQREQSNTGLPSFTLTLLCARHSHCPKSSRLPTRGVSFAMYPWKSSAQTQHGYSREKSRTKLTRSDCCVRDGVSGYCAAML